MHQLPLVHAVDIAQEAIQTVIVSIKGDEKEAKEGERQATYTGSQPSKSFRISSTEPDCRETRGGRLSGTSSTMLNMRPLRSE